MNFNSRFFSFLLAGVVSFFTTGFVFIIVPDSWKVLVVAFSISFSTTFIFSYLTLEFLIFKELNDMYTILNQIKNNEIIKRTRKTRITSPFKKLNQEIYDVARLKQTEINELKRMEEYRREFLANVSHELKTPIFAAQGFIQTLIDGAIKEKEVRKRFLKKASKSLDNLSTLVNDLLTISQLESGEITMQMEYFDINKLCDDIIDQLESKAEKRHNKITKKINGFDDNEVVAFADPNRIRQVLVNLIENAIKYGKENGNIEVIFKNKRNTVEVIVKDDGPGIEADKLPRLFERFFRVDKHRSRESGGTGLGLSIVKHILESHKSQIFVESEVGKGTTFWFQIANEEN